MIENIIKATACGITLKESDIFGIKMDEVFLYKEIAHMELRVECDNKRITWALLAIRKPGLSYGEHNIYRSSRKITKQKIKINNPILDWKKQILKNIPSYYRGWINMENSGPKSLYRFVIFDPKRVISLEESEKVITLEFYRYENVNSLKIIKTPQTPQALWWWDGNTCRKSTIENLSKQCSNLIEEKYKTEETNNMKKKINTDIIVKQTGLPQERVFVSTLGWIYIIGEKTRIHRNKCSDMIGFQGTDGNYYEVAENLVKVYVKENYDKEGNKETEKK